MSKIIHNIFENYNLKENPMLEFFNHRPKAAGTYRGSFLYFFKYFFGVPHLATFIFH